MNKPEAAGEIPDGFLCVRCEGAGFYCVDCGSIRCVCPFEMAGERQACEHDRGALKKDPDVDPTEPWFRDANAEWIKVNERIKVWGACEARVLFFTAFESGVQWGHEDCAKHHGDAG